MTERYDIVVVGGGVNGCGIARDAAGRGYSVLLCEQSDLGGATSSASTKLIHGGLRYLEHYEFRLVREALIEREVLLRAAPHIIWPLRFVLPHHAGLRPAWLLRLGLFLYDHLGGRKLLPPTRVLDLRRDPAGAALKGSFLKAFEYSDCWVDDARLVVLNARAAAERGARIRVRTRVAAAERQGRSWRVTLEDEARGETEEVEADLIVNAGGPWVDAVLSGVMGRNDVHNVRLVKGSHIVTRRLFDHDRSYIFQNADGRIVFAIPYEEDFTLIGTTDQDYEGDPKAASISESEIGYLLDAVGGYLKEPISRDDIVWSYSGVRPLYDDGASKAQEATRDYILKVDLPPGEAALINIFGGKITTFRRLSEAVVAKIEGCLGARKPAWTAPVPLPGGDFPVTGRAELGTRIAAEHPYLQEATVRRFLRSYGLDSLEILDGAAALADLGRHFGADLYEREVLWLMEKEWARRASDVAWRRSKLGLRLSKSELRELDRFMADTMASGSLAAE